MDKRSCIVKLASLYMEKEAQQEPFVSPGFAGANQVMPTTGGNSMGVQGDVGAMGAGIPGAGEAAEMPDTSKQDPSVDFTDAEPKEETEEKSALEKPTSWIVKFSDGNFWIGRVFPEKYMSEAITFLSERKSIPKEHVREYFEKLKEGKKETPEEISEAQDIDVPAEGAEGAAGAEMGMPEQAAPQGPSQSEQDFFSK